MLIKVGGVDADDLPPVYHADLAEMIEDYFDALPEEDIDLTFVETRTDDNELATYGGGDD
jgi:hypothetical protein